MMGGLGLGSGSLPPDDAPLPYNPPSGGMYEMRTSTFAVGKDIDYYRSELCSVIGIPEESFFLFFLSSHY